MSGADLYDDAWRFFPGGHLRERAETIADAIDFGEHEDGPADVPSEPPPPVADWTLTAGVQVTTRRRGYRFAGLVQPAGTGRWGVVGIATPETDESGGAGEEARAHEILDEHAHVLLGIHYDFGYALSIAERFALRADPPREHCGCSTVVMATRIDAAAPTVTSEATVEVTTP